VYGLVMFFTAALFGYLVNLGRTRLTAAPAAAPAD
jgi:hypothetical protein